MFPKVTVLMPVYNGEHYLKDAILSILNQTFPDFEFLIFNDGSTDKSEEIIKSFSDLRIKYFKSRDNQGYLVHLNQGLKIAEGEYIVRMDADDLSLPNRLEKQVRFMDERPRLGASGSWAAAIGAKGEIKVATETNSEMLRCKLFFANQLIHPSVIMRTSILRKYGLFYNPAYYYTEDYKMWLDISEYAELSNIPEVLLKCHIHSSQVSRLFYPRQVDNSERIAVQLLSKFKINFSADKVKMHYSLILGGIEFELRDIESWFLELQRANERLGIYSQQAFLSALAEKWSVICFRKIKFLHWLKNSLIGALSIGEKPFFHPKYSFWGALRVVRNYRARKNII